MVSVRWYSNCTEENLGRAGVLISNEDFGHVALIEVLGLWDVYVHRYVYIYIYPDYIHISMYIHT